MPTKNPSGMAGHLAKALRDTFAPASLPTPIEADIAALCARIERVGEDRRAAPFRHDQEHR